MRWQACHPEPTCMVENDGIKAGILCIGNHKCRQLAAVFFLGRDAVFFHAVPNRDPGDA